MTIVQKDHLLDDWFELCQVVQFAFQPIVGIHTGNSYGFEALLRGWQTAGFQSIQHFFDRAYEDGLIVEVNGMLLQRAIQLFPFQDIHLFFNLDNRVFYHPNGSHQIAGIIEELPFPRNKLVLEISERSPLPEHAYSPGHLPLLRGNGVQIALDDFGAGFSGLQVLYQAGADIIKLDRFFITDINNDAAKRIFIANLVNMAHTMGQRVVAEGVETTAEYYVCREIGCDYLQGYLVARPETVEQPLLAHYNVIDQLINHERRNLASNETVILRRLAHIVPIRTTTPIMDILKRFRTEPELSYIPVVNDHDEPQGIIREQDLKAYVFSPYGISLLMNRSYQTEFYSYIRAVPVISIHSRIDQIVELYGLDSTADALIVTEEGQYRGCLDSRKLLQILHERELATARDQNPLTRLPGNTIISEYLADLFKPSERWQVLVYIDINHFKPFNDTYGFRIGDRVIQLMADLLRSYKNGSNAFIGHIGGDDFFAAEAVDERALPDVQERIIQLISRFGEDVLGFYNNEDKAHGYISARDREGIQRTYRILTAMAAILLLPPHKDALPYRELGKEITTLKSAAKRSSNQIAIATLIPVLPENAPGEPGTVFPVLNSFLSPFDH